jgi:hypothetical protein
MTATYSVIEDRFDISELDQKKLILEFQREKFVFIVYNNVNESIEWLEDYFISNWETDLAIIFDNHQFLKANFWAQINVVYHSSQKTIVPTKFVEVLDYSQFILNFHHSDQQLSILNFKLDNEKTLLYHVPEWLMGFLGQTYPQKDLNFLPMEICQTKNKDSLVLFFSERAVNFSIFDQKGIIETKLMKINDATHFGKCLDFFLNENHCIAMLGSITNYSPRYNHLIQRKNKMVFGELSSEVKFTQFFAEVPKHKYFTIFNSIIFF